MSDETPVTTRLVLSTSPISTGDNADIVFTGTLAFASGAMTGASFVSVTVNSNARLPASAPSLTHTVIRRCPTDPQAGVTCTVRLELLPPNMILPWGTSVGFDDVPDSIRLDAGVSTSPIVNPIGPSSCFR